MRVDEQVIEPQISSQPLKAVVQLADVVALLENPADLADVDARRNQEDPRTVGLRSGIADGGLRHVVGRFLDRALAPQIVVERLLRSATPAS